MNQIENIIFDFGGVIYRINEKLATKRFRELSKYPDLFIKKIQNFNNNRLFLDYQLGFISSQNFRQKCKDEFYLSISDIDFDEAWNKTLIGLHPLSEMFIKEIKNKFKIVLLSNTNEIHYNHFKNECQTIFNDFDALFFSYIIQLAKPNIEIYDYVIRKMDFKPQATLFIDDSINNILAAKKYGLKTILVEKNNFDNLTKYFNSFL